MGAILLCFIGCKNSRDTVPFPTESEFAQPLTKPFTFGEAQAIEWVVTDPDSIRSLPERKFDFNTLPAKPFNIGEPQPLLKPAEEQKFDLNSLPDTAFNADKLPTQKLKFKTSLLGAPKITKAGLPTLKAGTARGIMEAGAGLGLPGNGRCFIQDKYGMFWIGTDKGLCRYDGDNVEIYSDAQGLADANIYAIAEDEKEQIWIGTGNGGIYVINKKSGLLKQVVDTFNHAGTVATIIMDKKGQVWLDRIGVAAYIINEEEETIKQFGLAEGLANPFVVEMMQDRQGLIWVGSANGISVINAEAGTQKRIKKSDGLSTSSSVGLLQDEHDRIWIGGDSGVNIINIKEKTIKKIGKEQGFDSPVASLARDKEGKVWMGTQNGLVYFFDEENNLFEKMNVTPGANNIIYNLFVNNAGQIWMGTTVGGCYFINTLYGRPGNFTKADGLGDNNVWAVLEDKRGLIWLGTYNGIDIYNPATKLIKHIGPEQGLYERNSHLLEDSKGQIWTCGSNFGISIIDIEKGTLKYFGKPQGLGNNNGASMIEDNKGQIWVSSDDGEVRVISLENKLIKKIKELPGAKGGYPIFSLTKDSKGRVWAGSLGDGVYVIDADGKTINRLDTTKGLISNEITTFLEGTDGKMWIGTTKGIEAIDLENKNLTTFTTNEGLASPGLWTLNEMNGRIYAGTSNGITILTPAKKEDDPKPIWSAATYGKAQGLTFVDFAENSSLVYKNQLWAGVDNQILAVFNEPKPDTIVPSPFVTSINIMDKAQAFSNSSFFESEIKNIDTVWKTEKDAFYLNKQLSKDTGYLQKNKISWDSTSGPYLLPVNLRLPYHQNYLSFTFTGNHFSNPDKTLYRYILEGIDKNWSPVSEKNFSENYRDLPPGDYTFKVSSAGMNGLWSTPAEFSFTITPPWWKTWWAYLLYAAAAIAIISAYIGIRSKALKKHNQQLEEKVMSRTNELRKSLNDLRETQNQLVQSEKMASLGELTAGIAHEIQNPLNFVNNFSEVNSELIAEMKQEIDKGNFEEVKSIANDINENEQKIIFHGKRADAIVKGMLQHSRSSSGVKEPTDINALSDEYLRLAYHGLRAKDKSFNATMKTDFDQTLGKINVVPQDMGRVILNLITNAFYSVTEKKKMNIVGYEPTVTVSTKKVNGKVEIHVKDNGNGVPQKVLDKIFQPFFTTKPTGEGTGLGLSMSYDIITKAHGGELNVNTKDGEFAEFIITIPQ
ncbi:MAG: two-component regulator propeller domain-containing protein [Chitinophagaceae bacterium]